MVIGHTIVDKIKYLYGDKVINIDIEHRVNSENGHMYALWIKEITISTLLTKME